MGFELWEVDAHVNECREAYTIKKKKKIDSFQYQPLLCVLDELALMFGCVCV